MLDFSCVVRISTATPLQVGLSENVILWFTDYLKGRTQCVQMEGDQSDLLEVVKGVLQVSVLGPLLFNIYCMYTGASQ